MDSRSREPRDLDPRQNRKWSGVLESLFWTVLALGIVLYGSGQHDLVTLLFHDSRVNRAFLWFGLINVVLNILLFTYVYGWLGYVRGLPDPARSGTLAVPAGAVTFVSTFLAFVLALWPVFGVLSLLQVVLVTYGIISALNFIPGIGPLRVGQRTRGDEGNKED
ncbi:hypothetical protein Agub_g6278 [Astrephomene gubernaculifera]|uniref:Transmembrane protein n=1 Tax=Astrephomene gubernaculifera TaxID=47775 RepID=A0AAD3DNN9_9CHLO|nr:hypothetical protein Agub_g6278 [Astrephomene gubernaculifera]